MPYGEVLELKCSRCNEIKSETEFSRESKNTSRNLRRYDCKSCVRARQNVYTKKPEVKAHRTKTRRVWNRFNTSGFTPDMYEERLKEQGYVCAICKTDTPGGKGQFHADHDHNTLQPRGVLCHNCNVGLGNLKDNPAILQAAIDYLKKYLEVK
jgi:hypothetical protein